MRKMICLSVAFMYAFVPTIYGEVEVNKDLVEQELLAGCVGCPCKDRVKQKSNAEFLAKKQCGKKRVIGSHHRHRCDVSDLIDDSTLNEEEIKAEEFLAKKHCGKKRVIGSHHRHRCDVGDLENNSPANEEELEVVELLAKKCDKKKRIGSHHRHRC